MPQKEESKIKKQRRSKMFNKKKIEELEDDIKHLHEVCITLTKMVDNLQGCLKDQLDINRLVRERLKTLEGEEDGRETISQLHQ
tara:strand:- start:1075 stop:1326 length:252 start_codon:yes stop_codon:yes gene_type:complete